MKFAIITDTHFGRGKNDKAFNMFADETKAFLDSTFFPTIKQHSVDAIIHAGDFYHQQRGPNTLTIDRAFADFHKQIPFDMKTYILVGNHDSFYRNTTRTNSLHYEDDTTYIIQSPFVLNETLLVPWIVPEDIDGFVSYLDTIPSTVRHCIGHLEIEGYELHAGFPSRKGMSPATFSRFNRVMSGHFHHKSDKGNIDYLGSHMQFDWGDYGDPRGFHIFDESTGKLEFFPNPRKLFHKADYTPDMDLEQFRDKMVRLIVTDRGDDEVYDEIIDTIRNEYPPYDLSIVDQTEMFRANTAPLDPSVEIDDTRSILINAAGSNTVMKEMLISLYAEAESIK